MTLLFGSFGFEGLTYDSGNDSWPIPELDFDAWLWTMNGLLGPQKSILVALNVPEAMKHGTHETLIRVGSHTTYYLLKI